MPFTSAEQLNDFLRQGLEPGVRQLVAATPLNALEVKVRGAIGVTVMGLITTSQLVVMPATTQRVPLLGLPSMCTVLVVTQGLYVDVWPMCVMLFPDPNRDIQQQVSRAMAESMEGAYNPRAERCGFIVPIPSVPQPGVAPLAPEDARTPVPVIPSSPLHAGMRVPPGASVRDQAFEHLAQRREQLRQEMVQQTPRGVRGLSVNPNTPLARQVFGRTARRAPTPARVIRMRCLHCDSTWYLDELRPPCDHLAQNGAGRLLVEACPRCPAVWYAGDEAPCRHLRPSAPARSAAESEGQRAARMAAAQAMTEAVERGTPALDEPLTDGQLLQVREMLEDGETLDEALTVLGISINGRTGRLPRAERQRVTAQLGRAGVPGRLIARAARESSVQALLRAGEAARGEEEGTNALLDMLSQASRGAREESKPSEPARERGYGRKLDDDWE